MNTTVQSIEKGAEEIASLILNGNYAEAKSKTQSKDTVKAEFNHMSYLLALSQVKKRDFQRYADYAKNMFGDNLFSPSQMAI